uniref:tRNA-dihydrouridine(47) synthase [NAD(P)(+)] n=1 Tax=Dunaliella tertiolecta TaxID=3047 RepID=A0A7S3QLV4_DUNTE|eukprot:CAMPEP_0202369810 /NCGR_PEP_ID=MMETSP1127-20130417/1560_1 /ASSEMBLY_ACC=CAM_ASM_000462 /TAXON_ID=3047 /ORGANISM="Dunaliella tertiolecta, Strain CCMP1320" /LENGTH=443 /DNA_ID=CAMNT_0048965575 /DNA_START=70 /DNA_END=1404 /DNA_ORIENTATION=-
MSTLQQGCSPSLAAPNGRTGRKAIRKYKRLQGNLGTNSDQPPPRLDYVSRMQQPSGQGCCPLLMLAPMENLADRPFRRALASMGPGGFDESCTEFMRIPGRAERPNNAVRGITSHYSAWELAQQGRPLGAQIMGSDPGLLSLAAHHLAHVKQAPRVDLNCGCPANIVTGHGAGSSLLRTPELLQRCVQAMVDGAGGQTIVTVKLRSGFDDTSLFEEDLLAAQEAGASFVTIHPRTKRQKYDGRAAWALIARARQLLHIPVVGNGDVINVERAHQLLQETNCSAIMVGRGAVQDPLLFHRIRFSFTEPDLPWEWEEPEAVCAFLRAYAEHAFGLVSSSSSSSSSSSADGIRLNNRAPVGSMASMMTERGKFGSMKKIMRYLFRRSPQLAGRCEQLLRLNPGDGVTLGDLLEECCQAVQQHWSAAPTEQDGPPPASVARLVGHRG